MLDSTDTIRMCVAKDELEQLVEHKEFATRRVPILFFANKMDLANALTPVECMEQLELDKLPGKSWHIAYGSLWVRTMEMFSPSDDLSCDRRRQSEQCDHGTRS